MKKFLKKMACTLYEHTGLTVTLWILALIGSIMGCGFGMLLLIAHLFHFASETAPDVKTAALLTIGCIPFVLLFVVLVILHRMIIQNKPTKGGK